MKLKKIIDCCRISEDVEADDSIFDLTKARLPWLILGLFGGLGSVFILESFESIMGSKELRSLFFYTPLIAAMAGNVGVQSSAIVVQGLANDVIKGSLISRLVKEISLTLLNGIILSLIIIVFGLLINQSLDMSITISVSMILVIIVAALIGTSVPIVLEKFGIDPAIATGPFITTGNDVVGILLFFYIAKLSLDSKMPKIIHLDENHELLKNELEKLGFKNYFDLISTKKEVEKKIWEYQGIILSRIEIDKFIDSCKNLKFIARVGSGLENIDTDYAKKKNIEIFLLQRKCKCCW